MEYFKSIIIFVLFAEVVLYIIAKKEYAKYIRLYMGLVVIVIAINPIVNFFKGYGIGTLVNEFQIEASISALTNEMVELEDYFEVLVTTKENGSCVVNVNISRRVISGDENAFISKIKNEIIKVYNVQENNINISIRG